MVTVGGVDTIDNPNQSPTFFTPHTTDGNTHSSGHINLDPHIV